MDLLLVISAFLLSFAGIAGAVIPGIPGPAVSYAGLLCISLTRHSTLSAPALWLWLALAVAVMLADYFLPAWMTRRFGGSRAGAIGATVGVFAGFLFFPPLGMIAGPFVGAVVGELLHDARDTSRALRVGVGSFLSFVVGTGIKLLASIAMLIHVAVDTWPAVGGWLDNHFF